jgi:arabinan endo-1,5-alpha-L-arabinosidase
MKKQTIVYSTIIGLVGAIVLAIASAQNRGVPATLPVDPAVAARLQQLGKTNARVHDPSTIVKCKDQFWVFYTGRGTPSYHSPDLLHWEAGPRVFNAPPGWVAKVVPENRSGMDFWAPDVFHLGDRYLLYYSASSFGKNVSAIGLAINPTLDPADPAYKWTDQGMVVQSTIRDDFNTIDPSVAQDANGGLWLTFGSFWSGIRMIQLEPATGKRIAPESPIYNLAFNGSIEASYLYFHDKYYYLFVDWGMCCRGANSTYNMRIGRGEKITGPYLDKDGRDLMDDGGTPLLFPDDVFIGPGHAGIVQDGDKSWLSMHFYDGTQRGASFLAIRPLTWSADCWPVVGQRDTKP